MSKPIAIDLFSGCGGLTLGLKQAGFSVVGSVEVDLLSVETYKANHPEVQVWHSDVRTVAANEIIRTLGVKKGQVDLIAGCPPCQGFSSMTTLNGKRNVDDPRNDLLFEFLRIVTELMPKSIMMENVPGLASDSRYRKWCEAIHKLGYSVEGRILNAADYGVPQRRRRLIFLAGRFGPIEFARASKRKKTVRDAIGRLKSTHLCSDPLHDVIERRSTRVLELIKRIPRNGGSRTDLEKDLQLACHKAFNGFKDVYGRMAWESVAPTITGGCINPSKGRFLHPVLDRAITLREAALLQSFPRKYKFLLNKGRYSVAELIGNALPPELIRRHACCITKYLENAS